MRKWLVWLTLLVVALLLMAAAIQGKPGSMVACIFTPASLGTQATTSQNTAATVNQQAPPLQTM